jgi:hypothetical protein
MERSAVVQELDLWLYTDKGLPVSDQILKLWLEFPNVEAGNLALFPQLRRLNVDRTILYRKQGLLDLTGVFMTRLTHLNFGGINIKDETVRKDCPMEEWDEDDLELLGPLNHKLQHLTFQPIEIEDPTAPDYDYEDIQKWTGLLTILMSYTAELQVLNCSIPLEADFITQMAANPELPLRELTMTFVDGAWDMDTDVEFDDTGFPSLEHLNLTDFSTSAKISRDILRAITPGTTLKTVQLTLPTKAVAPLSFAHVEEIFDILSLHTGLQQVVIIGKLDEEAQAHIRADRKSITSSLLSKLYHIPNIINLNVSLEQNPMIADLSTIHALMNAWPKLQHLVILPRSTTPVRRLDDIDFSAVHWETISFPDWIALLKHSPTIRNLPVAISHKDAPASVDDLQGFTHLYDGIVRVVGFETLSMSPELEAVLRALLPNVFSTQAVAAEPLRGQKAQLEDIDAKLASVEIA